MGFSYTPGGTSDKDRVRLLIGDTDSDVAANQRLEDEEILDLVDIFGSYRSAAMAAAEALSAKFAREVKRKGMGQASLEWDRFTQLRQLAKDLRQRMVMGAVPFAGGIRQSVRNTNEANTDLIKPSFKRGMLDDPSTLETSTTSTAA